MNEAMEIYGWIEFPCQRMREAWTHVEERCLSYMAHNVHEMTKVPARSPVLGENAKAAAPNCEMILK